jgi:hypothetical protein
MKTSNKKMTMTKTKMKRTTKILMKISRMINMIKLTKDELEDLNKDSRRGQTQPTSQTRRNRK